MTAALYYEDINQTEFDAQVVAVIPAKKGWKVVLDKTCFYPEGGGQPADTGWLNDIPVIDVQKEGDDLFHFIAEDPGPNWIDGKEIKGKIEWSRRFDFMQQHTGQHIISAALWKVGGYTTLSVHMGNQFTTIELAAPEISQEDLNKAEKLANQIIAADLPIKWFYVDFQDLHFYPLRKPPARTGKIRLVQIGDFDCVACGGLHMDRTHKIQLVKAIGSEKIRGNTRISWKIGERALQDYSDKDRIITRLRVLLSTREDLFEKKIGELNSELSLLKQKYNGIENQLVETRLPELVEKAHPLPGGSGEIYAIAFTAQENSFIKKVTKLLLKRENVVLCLVNVLPDGVQWCMGCSGERVLPFERIKGRLLPLIEGKGGGQSPFWQGHGTNPEGVPSFLAVFRSLVEEVSVSS